MSGATHSRDFIQSLCGEFQKHNYIDPSHYDHIDVKRGLRNADGTGVMAGITQIGNVQGYYMQDGEKTAMPGRLIYRGINVEDLWSTALPIYACGIVLSLVITILMAIWEKKRIAAGKNDYLSVEHNIQAETVEYSEWHKKTRARTKYRLYRWLSQPE